MATDDAVSIEERITFYNVTMQDSLIYMFNVGSMKVQSLHLQLIRFQPHL